MLVVAMRFVGCFAIDVAAGAGAIWRLALSAASRTLLGPFRGESIRFRATMVQSVRAGYGSLPLVALISVLAGMILSLQGAHQLERFGTLELVPALVAVSITRELGPLLTAIIVAGRVGAAIAAELGTMKVSQEIDALTVMGLDPVSFLVVPRLLALLITLPCLAVFSDLTGILGGLAMGVGALEMGAPGYVSLTFDALDLQDLYTGLVKAAAFAGVIGLVACYQGLKVRGGAEEVGRATTATVVHSIVLVVGVDFFVTALFYLRGQ